MRFVWLSACLHAVALGAFSAISSTALVQWPSAPLQLTLQPDAAGQGAPSPARPHRGASPATPVPSRHVRNTARRAPAAVAQPPPRPAPAAPPNHLLAQLTARLDRYFTYPALARRRGWEGEVRVQVRLDARGRVQPLEVVRSSGHPLLDRHAFETLARIGTVPELRSWLDGHSYVIEIPVTYRLVRG